MVMKQRVLRRLGAGYEGGRNMRATAVCLMLGLCLCVARSAMAEEVAAGIGATNPIDLPASWRAQARNYRWRW